jgi:hypothetical protein
MQHVGPPPAPAYLDPERRPLFCTLGRRRRDGSYTDPGRRCGYWKYDPPTPVTLARYTGERFSVDQVAGDLRDPPAAPRRPAQSEAAPARAADPLLRIAPAVYVEALTGRRVGRDGKVACPFHPDSRPSLHAYPDPAAGWACFSAKCWRGDRPNGATSTTSPASSG